LQDVDNYNYILSIIMPVNLLFSLGMRNVIAADQNFTVDVKSFFYYRISSMIFALLLIIFFFLVTNQFSILMIALVLQKYFDNLFDYYYGVYQREKKMSLIAQSQVVRSLFSLLPMVLMGLFYKNINTVFIVIAIVSFGLNIWEQRKLKLNLLDFKAFGASLKNVFKWVIKYMPLGIVSFIDSLSLNVPKYFLKASSWQNGVAIFSSLIILIYIVGFVVSALGNTLLPSFAASYLKNKNDFLKILKKALLLVSGISILMILFAYLFGQTFLEIIYNKEIAQYADEFFVLMICCFIWNLSSILSYSLYALKIHKEQLWAQSSLLVTIIFSSFFLIPKLGVMGAVIAFGIGQIARLMISVLILKRGLQATF